MNNRTHTHTYILLFCTQSKGHTLTLLHLVRPTFAVDLIGCYFTVGGGALRVYISEDETSQIDICLAHINLKLHCSLQGQVPKRSVGKGRRAGQGEEEVWRVDIKWTFLVLNPWTLQ